MIRRLLAPLLVFTATLLPAAPAVPLVNLVDEQTMFALSFTDVPQVLRGWDAGPIASTWNDPQIAKFLAPLRKTMKVDEWDDEARAATGFSVRELLGLAEGEALIAVPGFDVSKIDSMEGLPPFLFALEIGDQADKVEKLFAESREKNNLVEETEEFAGVTVHTRQLAPRPEPGTASDDADAEEATPPATISWAIMDGICVVAAEKTRVFTTIDAMKEGGVGAALGKSERYLRTRERVGNAPTLVFVNFPAIYPAVKEAIALSKAKSANAGMTPMGFDSETLFAALGLDTLGEGYLALSVNEVETRIDVGLRVSEERGLLKLMAYQPGPAPQPDWISAKWPSVSTARYSIPKAYEGLEQLLNAVNPMIYGMAQGRIGSFNKTLRIDIKRDLIGSLGDELISAYAVPADVAPGSTPDWSKMDQLIAISLSNEEAFVKSIEALKSLAGPAAEQMFLKREYLGHTLYTLNVPTAPDAPEQRAFSYAIANGMFLLGIGSPASVEHSLQGMAAGEGLFWKRDDVTTALAEVPADAASLQVQDLRVMIAAIIEMAVRMQEETKDEDTDGNREVYLDVSARPDEEVIARHWGMSVGYLTRTADGFFSTTRLAHPKK